MQGVTCAWMYLCTTATCLFGDHGTHSAEKYAVIFIKCKEERLGHALSESDVLLHRLLALFIGLPSSCNLFPIISRGTPLIYLNCLHANLQDFPPLNLLCVCLCCDVSWYLDNKWQAPGEVPKSSCPFQTQLYVVIHKKKKKKLEYFYISCLKGKLSLFASAPLLPVWVSKLFSPKVMPRYAEQEGGTFPFCNGLRGELVYCLSDTDLKNDIKAPLYVPLWLTLSSNFA